MTDFQEELKQRYQAAKDRVQAARQAALAKEADRQETFVRWRARIQELGEEAARLEGLDLRGEALPNGYELRRGEMGDKKALQMTVRPGSTTLEWRIIDGSQPRGSGNSAVAAHGPDQAIKEAIGAFLEWLGELDAD